MKLVKDNQVLLKCSTKIIAQSSSYFEESDAKPYQVYLDFELR